MLLLTSFLALLFSFFTNAQDIILKSGNDVIIQKGQQATFPTSGSITIGTLTVYGKLRCRKGSVTVFLKNLFILGGELQCTGRTVRKYYRGYLRLQFTSQEPKLIISQGGKLVLRGRSKKSSWSRLRQTLDRGSNQIIVDLATMWEVGDEIVVAPTDFKPDAYEAFKITKKERISDTLARLTLDASARYTHFGRNQRYGGKMLRNQAEVALLTRSIQIYGDPTNWLNKNMGISITLFERGSMQVDNVEIRWAGHFDKIGGYPVHFHNVRDGTGMFLSRSSIYKSKNRCLSIHCTDNVLIRETTCIDHIGHGFFFEDGSEQNNLLSKNLGMLTREGTGNLMLSDKSDGREGPATYWTTNPNNKFDRNIVAGSVFFGFSFEFLDNIYQYQRQRSVCPERIVRLDQARTLPIPQFSGNKAHSTLSSPFWIGDGYSPKVPVYLTGLQAYKIDAVGNFPSCLWINGWNIRAKNMVCADFVRALWLVFETSLSDSVFIAMSNNLGNPVLPHEIRAGRSIPSFRRISGHNVYDGPSSLDDVHFINFYNIPNSDLFSYHFDIFGGSFSSSKNAVGRMKFSSPSNIKVNPNSGIPRLIDRDGSVTGITNGIFMNAIQLYWDLDKKQVYQSRSLDPLTNDGSCQFWLESMVRCGPGAESALVVLFQPGSQKPIPRLTAWVDGTNANRALIPRDIPPGTYEFYLRPSIRNRLVMDSVEECMVLHIQGGRMGDVYRIVFETKQQRQNNARIVVSTPPVPLQVNSESDLSRVETAAYFFDQNTRVLHVAMKISERLTLVGKNDGFLGYGNSRGVFVCLR